MNGRYDIDVMSIMTNEVIDNTIFSTILQIHNRIIELTLVVFTNK